MVSVGNVEGGITDIYIGQRRHGKGHRGKELKKIQTVTS
jgi:hypothetical protein